MITGLLLLTCGLFGDHRTVPLQITTSPVTATIVVVPSLSGASDFSGPIYQCRSPCRIKIWPATAFKLFAVAPGFQMESGVVMPNWIPDAKGSELGWTLDRDQVLIRLNAIEPGSDTGESSIPDDILRVKLNLKSRPEGAQLILLPWNKPASQCTSPCSFSIEKRASFRILAVLPGYKMSKTQQEVGWVRYPNDRWDLKLHDVTLEMTRSDELSDGSNLVGPGN